MMQNEMSQVDSVNPLIRLVREREDLFFQLLGFVNSNLSSSNNDLDITTIFNRFTTDIDLKHAQLKQKQTSFISSLPDPFQDEQIHSEPISKLSSRLLEILEASIDRVTRSIFNESGKAGKDFSRFKSSLNKIIKQQFFNTRDYAELVVGYTSHKYQKQFLKIKKYIEKVKQGEDIWLKDLYYLQKSDHESSPSPNEKRSQSKTVRKLHKKVDLEHLNITQEPEKKNLSLKKTVKTALKKRSSRTPAKQQIEAQSPTKQKAGSRLYKFYSFLELNKKEFLEDYIYEKSQQEKHKADLLKKLMERNKNIDSQINSHVKKSVHCLPIPITPVLIKSSGDQKIESASSRVSLRKSFVISKRKNSHHFEASTEHFPSSEKKQSLKQTQSTVKNLSQRRRSSHSSQRVQQKSKKMFVVKAPMVFEEQIIPQAQITQTQWLQAPLTVKCHKQKKPDIRQRRKNNVNPLQNAFLPQNFRYPL